MRFLFIFHFGFSDQTKLEMLPFFFFLNTGKMFLTDVPLGLNYF